MKKILAIAMAACVSIGSGYGTQAIASTTERNEIAATTQDVAVEGIGNLMAGAVALKDIQEVESGDTISLNNAYDLYDFDGLAKFYKINIPADGVLLVQARRMDANSSFSRPQMTLCNSSMKDLKALSSMYTDSSMEGVGAQTFAVTQGTYYIKTLGNINTVERIVATFETQALSANSTKAKATTIGPKKSVNGMLALTSNISENWYTFNLKSNQPNELAVTNESLSSSLSVVIQGPNGISYTSSVPAGKVLSLYMTNSYGAKIDWTKGTYYIKVAKAATDANAKYSISRKAYIQAMDITAVADKTYTGKAIKPAVTVKNGSEKLVANKDYTVQYLNNKKVGKASITITGKGDYLGSQTINFNILPKGTSIKKIAAGKKKLTVTWKKNNTVNGYQIRYSTSSKMTKAKTAKKITKKTTTKQAISKLKSKKTYYVQIRTYKKVSGKVYYSKWSKAVKKKVK